MTVRLNSTNPQKAKLVWNNRLPPLPFIQRNWLFEAALCVPADFVYKMVKEEVIIQVFTIMNTSFIDVMDVMDLTVYWAVDRNFEAGKL